MYLYPTDPQPSVVPPAIPHQFWQGRHETEYAETPKILTTGFFGLGSRAEIPNFAASPPGFACPCNSHRPIFLSLGPAGVSIVGDFCHSRLRSIFEDFTVMAILDFKGRVAIVTGAASELADNGRRLGHAGADVVVNYHPMKKRPTRYSRPSATRVPALSSTRPTWPTCRSRTDGGLCR